jgi:hypothetical protein
MAGIGEPTISHVTKWERFGDDTWINTDHVEVVRVEEQEDGRWQLTAAFTSGRTYPIGSHEDRDLLADCTDALLRGHVGERLLDLAGVEDAESCLSEALASEAEDSEATESEATLGAEAALVAQAVEAPFGMVAPAKRRWWFRRAVARSL